MNKLTQQFVEMTGSSVADANSFLKTAKYDFNVAIDLFFQHQAKIQKSSSNNSVKQFKSLAGSNNLIEQNGLVKLFNTLQLGFDDCLIGYLFYLMRAKCNNQINQEQFSNIFTQLKIDSIADLKKRLPQLRTEFNKPQIFKSVYLFLFDLYKQNPKNISYDLAVNIWSLYLKGRFSFYNELLEYLSKVNDKKWIPKDTWRMLIEFEFVVGKNLNNYNESDGWPLFIDSFVNYIRESKKIEIQQ